MKKGIKLALIGAAVASVIPFVVDVDDSEKDRKRTSVKSVLYRIDLTTIPADREGGAEKTNVSVTVPGLLGDWIAGIKCKNAIPDEMIQEIVEKIDKSCTGANQVKNDSSECQTGIEAPASELE